MTTRAAAMLALVASACAHHRQTYVELHEVHEHLMALRAHGTAKVDAIETDRDRGNNTSALADRRTTVWIDLDRAIDVDGRTLTLRQLAEGCPNQPPAPIEDLAAPCGLFVYRDTTFVASSRSFWNANSYWALATGLGGLAAGGGAIYCGIECTEWSGAKTVGLGVGSVILLLASAIYSGGRD